MLAINATAVMRLTFIGAAFHVINGCIAANASSVL